MGSFKRHLTSLLLKLADGQNKLNDLSSNSTKVTKGIALRLSRLLELNIISKNGNFYYICDRLFSFWLRSVYQKDTNTFNYDRRSQAACFKDLLKVSIDSFSRVSQKNLANRVLELFYSFDNEYFQFNGHKYRLPIFKEIKSLKYAQQNPASFDSIIARGSQISWLVLLKEEEVFEDDINNFLEETKRFNLKPEKKILIFANGIEPNARLKALQEKMWLWNLSDLNLLMNFYHKPYFII
jgi:hypothetical protein